MVFSYTINGVVLLLDVKFVISPLPVKPGGGVIGSSPSVSLSVPPSVSPPGVRPLGLPDFSQSSFEILT